MASTSLRRGTLRALCMALLVVLLTLAIGSGAMADAPRPGPRPGVANSPNPLTVGLPGDVAGLDPAQHADDNSVLVNRQIYETLVSLRPADYFPQAGLAESWSTSGDGRVWTFVVRSGVKFHDNTDLDAAAVVYNLQRWWDPQNAHHPTDADALAIFAGYFGGFKGDAGCLISGIAAVGSSQVEITMTQRLNNLPTALSLAVFGIASPTAIQAGTLDTQPAGTGPFKLGEWVQGDHVRLLPNGSYWGLAPRIGSLTFRVVASDADRFAAVQAGTVNTAVGLPTSYLGQVASDLHLRALWRPDMTVAFLGINNTRTALSNVLVRQAIAHAIDRQTLARSYFGAGAVAGGQLPPPSVWGTDPSLTDYAYDPSAARALLAQAGFGSGFSTTLSLRASTRGYMPQPIDTAHAITESLKAVGINATVSVLGSADFIDKANNGDLDLWLLGWSADMPHPDSFFSYNVCGDYRSLGQKDTELCNLVAAAETEPSLTVQLADYRAASKRVLETVPLLPLAHTQSSFVVARDDVLGLVPSTLAAESYQAVDFASAWDYLPLIAR